MCLSAQSRSHHRFRSGCLVLRTSRPITIAPWNPRRQPWEHSLVPTIQSSKSSNLVAKDDQVRRKDDGWPSVVESFFPFSFLLSLSFCLVYGVMFISLDFPPNCQIVATMSFNTRPPLEDWASQRKILLHTLLCWTWTSFQGSGQSAGWYVFVLSALTS